MLQFAFDHNSRCTLDHMTTNLMEERRNGWTRRHSHPVFHLMFVVGGEGRFQVGDEEFVAAEGHLFIINPDVPHCFFFDPRTPLSNYETTFMFLDAEGIPASMHFGDWLRCSGRGLAVQNGRLATRLSVPAAMRPPLLESYHRLLSAFGQGAPAHYIAIMIADLLMRVEEIVVRVQRLEESAAADRGDAASIMAAKQYLRHRLHEKVSLPLLADHVHLNANYLCTLFKERTGSSPMGYLQHLRMSEAERLLLYTDLPVYQVAERTGFEQATYFAKVFRKAFACSPSEYRKQRQRHD